MPEVNIESLEINLFVVFFGFVKYTISETIGIKVNAPAVIIVDKVVKPILQANDIIKNWHNANK